MARQPLVVSTAISGVRFRPRRPGPPADIDYHGHLDLADVDGDGRLDCAVAVYIGAGGFGTPGRVKLYRGNGDGTFSANPIWTCAANFYCFSVAFGDVNMDGRPDLACVAGESYNHIREKYRVFRNVGGALETTPYWQSADDPRRARCHLGRRQRRRHPRPGRSPARATACPTDRERDLPRNRHDAADHAGLAEPGRPRLRQHPLPRRPERRRMAGPGRGGQQPERRRDRERTVQALPEQRSRSSRHDSRLDLDLRRIRLARLLRRRRRRRGPGPRGRILVGHRRESTRTRRASCRSLPTWQSTTSSVIENIVWEDVNNDGLQPDLTARFTGRRSAAALHPAAPSGSRAVGGGGRGAARPDRSSMPCGEQGWLTIGARAGSGRGGDGALRRFHRARPGGEQLGRQHRRLPLPQPSRRRRSATGLAAAADSVLALQRRSEPGARREHRAVLRPGRRGASRAMVFSADGRLVRVLERLGRVGIACFPGMAATRTGVRRRRNLSGSRAFGELCRRHGADHSRSLIRDPAGNPERGRADRGFPGV